MVIENWFKVFKCSSLDYLENIRLKINGTSQKYIFIIHIILNRPYSNRKIEKYKIKYDP